MNGNIALSMEIGSAYALQVCLLQIPALVLFSAIIGQNMGHDDLLTHTFKFVPALFRGCTSADLLQPHLPSMGYGHCHPLRVFAQLRLWRGQGTQA